MDYLTMDPNMLYSLINMRLRDHYDSLDGLCDDMEINADQLQQRLESAGFAYVPEVNQFRPTGT